MSLDEVQRFTFNGTLWHGHSNTHCLSMSQETFEQYVSAYLQTQRAIRQRVLTSEEAMHRVTELSYWSYAHYDRRIHVVRLPGCVLPERNKADGNPLTPR